MNRSASSVTVGTPRSVVFWSAGSCPWATDPKMTLARARARSGAILAAHRRAAPCACPINDHVGLRPGGAYPHAEAGHGVIPYGELAAVGLEGIHHPLGNSLCGHWLTPENRPGQHRGSTET